MRSAHRKQRKSGRIIIKASNFPSLSNGRNRSGSSSRGTFLAASSAATTTMIIIAAGEEERELDVKRFQQQQKKKQLPGGRKRVAGSWGVSKAGGEQVTRRQRQP